MGAASTPEHAQYGLISSHFRALMKCKHKEVSLARSKKKKGAGFIPIWPTFLFPSSVKEVKLLLQGSQAFLGSKHLGLEQKPGKSCLREALCKEKGAFSSDTQTSTFVTLGLPQITIFS